MKTVLINKTQERIIKELLQHGKILQEGIDMNGAGGVRCECDFDEDDYIDWLENDCGGMQDTPELRIKYVKDFYLFPQKGSTHSVPQTPAFPKTPHTSHLYQTKCAFSFQQCCKFIFFLYLCIDFLERSRATAF